MGKLLKQLEEYLANATKEQLDADWDELKRWNKYGPTVEEYLETLDKTPENKENKKNVFVYIRGVKGRGKEILKTLEDLGGKNTFTDTVWDNEACVYYISALGQICFLNTELAFDDWIKNNYTEIFLPYIPKDKELVWAWYDNQDNARLLCFYNEKSNCVFADHVDSALCFNHYAPYKGEWPEWAKEALNREELLRLLYNQQ